MSTRYILASETGIILGTLGVFLAVASLWMKGQKGVKVMISALFLLVSGALVANYINVNHILKESYAKIPNVCNIPLSTARTVIRTTGLVEKPIATEGQRINEESIVQFQSPEPYSYGQEGTEVILIVSSESTNAGQNTVKDIPIAEEPASEATNSAEPLTLQIENYDFTNQYHYEQPVPGEQGAYWLIDFGAGISGTFSYSRQLSAQELENWMHGGKLYDANEKEVGVEGNYPSFWSSPEGLFAVEFPADLPHGSYTYELYQFIDGKYVSDTVKFTI